jgi:hypothetical protein
MWKTRTIRMTKDGFTFMVTSFQDAEAARINETCITAFTF